MMEAEREGFHKKFKLEGALTTSNMVGAVCAAYDLQCIVCIHISLSLYCMHTSMCEWMHEHTYGLRGLHKFLDFNIP